MRALVLLLAAANASAAFLPSHYSAIAYSRSARKGILSNCRPSAELAWAKGLAGCRARGWNDCEIVGEVKDGFLAVSATPDRAVVGFGAGGDTVAATNASLEDCGRGDCRLVALSDQCR